MLTYLSRHMSFLREMRDDYRAVTAMEYGLIAALVAVVIITALKTIGTSLDAKFDAIAAALT